MGGWQPYTQAQLAQRYQSESNYLSLYGADLQKLVSAGYVLPGDVSGMLTIAGGLYTNPNQ